MKKQLLRLALLTALAAAALCASAMAETVSASGFYSIGSATNAEGTAVSGVKVTPAASSGTVESIPLDVDGNGNYLTVYNHSDKLTVTYTNSSITTSSQILVMLVGGTELPTAGDTIYYIDQLDQQSGSVTFDVYPLLPNASTTMTLFITSGSFATVKVALKYANGVFEKAEYILGDVDGIVGIDTRDAASILRYFVGSNSFSATQIKAADVNQDGIVDTRDAVKILRYYVGLDTIG